MKKFVATFAAIAAIGMGSAAMAQSAMSGDAMHAAPTTMICHVTAKGETPNAKMGTEDITCKPFDFAKAKATIDKMMTSMTTAPTEADVQAAWTKAFGSAYSTGSGM